jgi:hypothetical protein
MTGRRISNAANPGWALVRAPKVYNEILVVAPAKLLPTSDPRTSDAVTSSHEAALVHSGPRVLEITMGGVDRAGMPSTTPSGWKHTLIIATGGKAKPLKAPKKAPKGEMDEEDKAFQEKQKAGT